MIADGEILVGELTCFFGGMIASELICHGGARLSIGRACELNYGVSIEAQREVRLGASCKIGSMVRIADASRLASGPVVIEDEVRDAGAPHEDLLLRVDDVAMPELGARREDFEHERGPGRRHYRQFSTPRSGSVTPAAREARHRT